MSVEISPLQSPTIINANIVGSFIILNDAILSQRDHTQPCVQAQLKYNISFNPPGSVTGSESKVEEEEKHLCKLLLEDMSKRRTLFQPKLYWYSWNTPVTSVLQGYRRPVCGMVALCMAGQMLKKKDEKLKLLSDNELLDIARQNGYTKQGEMFSANDYAELAKQAFGCNAVVISDTMVNSVYAILDHLAKGLPVLVPYDSDRNYEPCRRKGHKAHWAILTGAVMASDKQHKAAVSNEREEVTRLANPHKLLSSSEFNIHNIDPGLVFVYAKQGKSARQQLWSLKELSVSNDNLIEPNPNKKMSLFHIPEEGIKNTLCRKFIMLHPALDFMKKN